MLFKCIRRCHGYKRRLWEVDQTVEVGSDEEQPPHHFVAISAPEPVKVVEPEKPMSLASMTNTPVITTGMAAGLDHSQPQEPETSGKRRKKK